MTQFKMLVVPVPKFSVSMERLLSRWFEKNHRKLGYTRVVPEYTEEYRQLKIKMKFAGRPDYLGKKREDGKWEKVEIKDYYHATHANKQKPNGYCDRLICWTIRSKNVTTNYEITSITEFYGAQAVVTDEKYLERWRHCEGLEFVHLNEEEFL